MKTKAFALLVLVLLLAIPLAGCNRAAVENVEDVNTQMEQAAAENSGMDTSPVESPPAATEVTSTEVAETPPEAAPPSTEPTEAPTEVPTEAPSEQPPATEPTPAPTEPVASEPTAQPPVSEGQRTHIVQAGENLFRIALRYGTTVEAIAQANGITNPALIYVGQELVIPASSSATPAQPPASGNEIVYVVHPGENLFRIALKYNMSYLYLAQYNGISNPNLVVVGQQIRIPVQP